MDPGVVARIEELKSAIPAATVGGLLAGASELTPADVLAMLSGTSPIPGESERADGTPIDRRAC